MAELFELKNKRIGYHKVNAGKSPTSVMDATGNPIMREWVIQSFSVNIGNQNKPKWAPCVYHGRTVIDPTKPISFTFNLDVSCWTDKNTQKKLYKLQLKVIEFNQDEKPFSQQILPVDDKPTQEQEKQVENWNI